MKKNVIILLSFITANCWGSSLVRGDTIGVDTISFELQKDYLRIDSSAQNLWQIGSPSKSFLAGAYSGENAIITDKIENYSINNSSYFDLIFINNEIPFQYGQEPSIGVEFKHKFDTDSLRDGGYLTISYDNGHSWENIIDDTNGPYYCRTPAWGESKNLYSHTDSLIEGNFGFSGKSNGWIKTSFAWENCAVKSTTNELDTIIIRFNFISDSIDNSKEGWMIDDIRLFSIDIGSNITRNSEQNLLEVFPNPVCEYAIVRSSSIMTKLEIIDYTGRLVKSYNPDSFETSINTTDISEGLYFLRAYNHKIPIGTFNIVINK